MDTVQFTDPDYWRSIAPEFHIDDTERFEASKALPFTEQQREQFSGQLKEEGYIQESADWSLDIDAMADAVRRLSDANLPPVLAFLYDEFWLPFRQLRAVLAGLLGGQYFFLPDFWIWNIDPQKNEAGWRPHRDKGKKSLFEDGSPKSVTVWIPLSDATPLNGCMYVVPAIHDTTYGTDAEDRWNFEYSAVRALPARPGEYLIWNQALLHWGGRSSPRASESRVSMSFEFQRADVKAFNNPLIDPVTPLPFDFRLKLIAKQVLQYRHMYKVDPYVEAAAWRLRY